jgi:5'-deoxynucleotidase
MKNKSTVYHFFSFLNRMKYIHRWGLMRNTQHENIQEHSLQVAMIAHALASIKNTYFDGNLPAETIAVLGIFHDCSEIITGDMPTPVKYFDPNISMAYNTVEEVAKNKLLSMLPEELKHIYTPLLVKNPENKELFSYVKAADRISAYIKCLEEEKAGNKEFVKAGKSILKTIKQLHMPEVSFFLDHFLPSYQLSLDEIE